MGQADQAGVGRPVGGRRLTPLAWYSRHSVAERLAVDALERPRCRCTGTSAPCASASAASVCAPNRSARYGVESDAVGVHRGAARPVGQPAVDAVERLEARSPRRLADNRAEVARMKPAFAGDHALLVGREPFDLPRPAETGSETRMRVRPKIAADDPRPPFRPIEVNDVRELVGERDAQPVVEREVAIPTATPRRSRSCRRGSGVA